MINKKIELNQHLCPYCNYRFGRGSELNRHLKQKSCKAHREQELIKNITEKVTANIIVKLDNAENTSNLSSNETNLNDKLEFLERQIVEQNEKIAKLTKKSSHVINNNLQIICIGKDDNYLDMLTQKWNNFDRALEYIKDCALSDLAKVIAN